MSAASSCRVTASTTIDPRQSAAVECAGREGHFTEGMAVCYRLPMTVALFLSCAFADAVSAQQIGVSTPNQTLSDGYFERFGVGFGLGFRQGSFGLALPQFGGYAPGAGATGGFGPFGFEASQGSRQSLTSQSPGVMVPNGGSAFIGAETLSPFVIGNVPVVGGFPVITSVMPPMPQAAMPMPAGNFAVQQALQQARGNAQPGAMPGGAAPAARPQGNVHGNGAGGGAPRPRVDASSDPATKLAAAQTSSAGRAVASVDEAKQALEVEKAGQIERARGYLQRGQEAEQAGKAKIAKIYYQMAARHGSGGLKADALARLHALDEASKANP